MPPPAMKAEKIMTAHVRRVTENLGSSFSLPRPLRSFLILRLIDDILQTSFRDTYLYHAEYMGFSRN